jgi:aminoglycoside 6'-N-acetyltransferase
VNLTGQRVVLRPASAHDVARLTSILSEPEVAHRWGTFDEARVAAEFVEDDKVFVVEVDGEVIGSIQYAEEDEPMYRHAGIDIFLTVSQHLRGFGTDAIRTLARYLFDQRGHHRLTIDPAADNEAAIKAYEKVGFRPVGVMRAYERGPDGAWHDGLLMDMLVGELLESSKERSGDRGGAARQRDKTVLRG